MWLIRTDATKPWIGLDLEFSTKEQDMFFASTRMAIGDGNTTRFWTDRWIDGKAIMEIASAVFNLVSKRLRKSVTVAQGLDNNSWSRPLHGRLHGDALLQFLQIWPTISHFRLNTEPDKLIWRWTANGTYTASSYYRATFHGAVLDDSWELTWKSWAPRKVKFFFWRACLNRCWTVDRLQRRDMPHQPRCGPL
jgi:hypothetical protein